MKCKICNAQTSKIFSTMILKKYKNVKYWHCSQCGFLQTEDPFWLEEAYCNAISSLDTGIMTRNISLMQITSVLIYFLFNKYGQFLDFAGGYGVFTRMMRDIGFDYFWSDLYADNLFADGFEYEASQKIGLVSAFECFEHFVSPLDDIDKIMKISSNVIFSTQLLPNPVPNPDRWWYYALESGQHIAFYSTDTLSLIAKKYDVNLYSYGGIHLFTKKKINNFVFNKIMQYGNKWFFSYVKRNMKCKAVDDHEFIKSLLNKERVD